MNKVYVIGIGFRPLGEKAGHVVRKSDAVLAGARLTEVFKRYSEYEAVKDRIISHSTVYEMLDYLADNYQTKKITVLAAGDPMFFGIGRLIIERFGKDAVEVHPDLSSVQVAFSRIAEVSNNALLLSLHGGPDPAKRRKLEYELSDIPALCDKYNKLAILTDKVNNPAVIADVLHSSLVTRHLSLKIFVCERLGYDDEKIISGTPEEIAGMEFREPNVVIIVKTEDGKMRRWEDEKKQEMLQTSQLRNFATSFFGLREDEIQHTKGLITKDEVRAVTIHALQLPRRGVFWDIGAGSGSVSIEAARLCPELSVLAVEKNEEQITNIDENKKSFGVSNVEIIKGEAPDTLKGLPKPDRVFIGGSGGNLGAIADVISEQMSSGIVVINAATLETLNEAVQELERHNYTVTVSEISVSRSKDLGGKKHMSALNPVFVIVGRK